MRKVGKVVSRIMIRYIIMDIDGTLTDGKIYMGASGELMKAFSVKDGMAINYILKPAGIVPIVVTARTSKIVQKRCEELGIEEVYQGKVDKVSLLKKILADKLQYCAYFGDDILDLKCMRLIKEAGGIVACPADAVKEVKAICNYICINRAGEGALREFSEWLVDSRKDENDLKERISKAVSFLKTLRVTERDIGDKVIINENFYYTVQKYVTKPTNERKLESHKKYVDIQIILEGNEMMDLADISRLSVKKEYDEANDVIFWEIPDRMARMVLRKGSCIVLYPENAHRGGINVDTDRESDVLKIVGKVRLLCDENIKL